MQVEPHRLVELAASSETLLADMLDDWEVAMVDIAGACSDLGDAAGTAGFVSAYGDAVVEAGGVVSSITQSLRLGVEGLVAAASEAVKADETVATELGRATQQVDGFVGQHGRGRGRS